MREASDIVGFGLFCRGTFESSIEATIIGGGPVADFFMRYFNKTVWEMLCLFESFATSYNTSMFFL